MTEGTLCLSTPDELARFEARIDRSPNGLGCWYWTGGTNGKGYGLAYVRRIRRTRGAHRVAYETYVGPIPEGLTIDHLCNVPRCVNPSHLEPVTLEENLKRAWRRDPDNRRGGSHKTHCIKGHPLSGDNVYSPPGAPTRRMCRTCRQAEHAISNAKRVWS